MAGNHLSIGAGIGEAGIWNAAPAVKAFTDVVAQQRAQRLANQQSLLEQAGKINPNGIRQPDQQDYLSKYNDWKQSAMQANQLPQNSRARMDALFNAQQKFGELNNFIGQSKLEGQNEHQLIMDKLKDPHMFNDASQQQILKSTNSSMSSPDFVPSHQYGNFEREIDAEKINKNLDEANKVLIGQSSWSNPIQSQGLDKQGNKTGVVVHNERSVDPEKLLSTHMHIATASPDVQKYLDSQYPDLKGNMHGQVLQNLIDRGNLAVDKNGQLTSNVAEKTKPEFKSNYKPDNFYAHYDYRLANPAGGGTPASPAPIDIPYKGAQGQAATMHAPNYVPLSLPNKNFAGAIGVNLETGRPEKALNSSDTYSIVGAGDFPVIKQGRDNAGALSQPGFAAKHPDMVEYKRMVHVQQKDPISEVVTSHLIPYDNLPKNVANQKDVRTALSGFNKTPVYGQQQQSATVSYKVNGTQYNIPSSKAKDFEKQFPKAQKVQ